MLRFALAILGLAVAENGCELEARKARAESEYRAGAGILSGDRLGCMNASIAGFGRCLQAVIDLGRPLLVLGAGGFNQTNTARAWCHATGMLCAEKLAELCGDQPLSSARHSHLDRSRSFLDETRPLSLSRLVEELFAVRVAVKVCFTPPARMVTPLGM